MYNMTQLFNATKLILTGELITYKKYFEDKLLNEFYSYCEPDNVKVEFMEETKRVVYGAAMIAAQGAIDEIEV